jgi:hypothetical protein
MDTDNLTPGNPGGNHDDQRLPIDCGFSTFISYTPAELTVSANPANPDGEIVLGVALVGQPVSTRIVLSLDAAAEAAWRVADLVKATEHKEQP